MRSQLVRHVLRRHLPAHWGPLPPCATVLASRSSLRRHAPVYRVTRLPQRRSFFGLFQKAPRTLKEPELEPGLGTMLKFSAHMADDLQPPRRGDLIKAFRDFFKFKHQNRRPVNPLQAGHAYAVLDYLAMTRNGKGFPLSIQDLRMAQHVLMMRPSGDPSRHVELLKRIYNEIFIQFKAQEEGEERTRNMVWEAGTLMRALSQYGRSREARDYLDIFWPKYIPANMVDHVYVSGMWIPVLRGLTQDAEEDEVLDFLKVMEGRGATPHGQTVHEIMTTFYARRNEFEKMTAWFAKPINPPEAPATPQAYEEALRCAMRNEQRDWALSLYQTVVNSLDSHRRTEKHFEQVAVLVYRFAVLLLDKGPDYIEHMLTTSADRDLGPSLAILNATIEAAMEKKDEYLAERFASLIFKLGMQPDNRTHALQMASRISANDLDGAFSSFRALQNFDSNDDDWPILNKLIRALCHDSAPNYGRVLEVTTYLEHKSVTLEPKTVVAICLAFLKNDEQYEVIDTLSLHTLNYSLEERQLVCRAFVDYCLDNSNSTARVWDAYSLLRQFFPDLAKEDRVRIMDAFYQRKRADMACHVFGHMRQQDSGKYRPTLDTYVRCLEGLQLCPDAESLKLVHNMLKMDTTIQPNTRLYNALMIAYTACEDYDRSLDFWREISNSTEGPSYNTLEIIFRTYQITPYGDKAAKALWQKLHQMEVDIPPNVYVAYAAMLAAQDHMEEMKQALEEMEAKVGQRPNVLALGACYNALQTHAYKNNFEEWAKFNFPQTWNGLLKHRRKKDSFGLQQFRIDWAWKA